MLYRERYRLKKKNGPHVNRPNAQTNGSAFDVTRRSLDATRDPTQTPVTPAEHVITPNSNDSLDIYITDIDILVNETTRDPTQTPATPAQHVITPNSNDTLDIYITDIDILVNDVTKS